MSVPLTATSTNPEQVMKPEKQVSQRTGNRCGHDPAKPRLLLTENPYRSESWQKGQLDGMGSKRKAAIFYDVAEALNEFYFHPKTLPTLGFIYKDEGVKRQHRTCAREADAPLLTALVQHMELASINWKKDFARVGQPTKNGFLYYDNKYWMQKTGLSAPRLKNSFRRLRKKGYIQRERRWVEREKGKFKGLATMTLINLSFFRDIGVFEKLKDASRYAYNKLCEAAKKLEISAGRMLACPVMKEKKEAEVRKKLKTEKASAPEDFPTNREEHWTCRLNAAQKTAFKSKYLTLIIERGEADNPAELYRESYHHVVAA